MSSPSTTNQIDPVAQKNAALWLQGSYDEKTKQAVRQLLNENPKEATDAFYTTLSFGTGGLRGTMGVGSNRMNNYTVRAATQGLANYINMQPAPKNGHSVFIGYDSRHFSKEFAEEAARVLAANGIKALLCSEMRPTPFVSFGCRYFHCTAAIVITASHNPPQYNGYKIYWSDGGQVLPPHDEAIIKEVNRITDPDMVKRADSVHHPLIAYVPESTDDAYIYACNPLQNYPVENREHGAELKIVYTSLHGTGITLVPKMLESWGLTHITYVKDQIIPNGDFPTARYPNPEMKETLKLGIEVLTRTSSDLLIATDPDTDRVGVVVLHQDKPVQLDGNQVASILLFHVCCALVEQKRMPINGAFVKTIVTTELFREICNTYKKPCVDVLSGFKYIADKIHEWELTSEGYQFVFGGEDSCGYLLGSVVRDKDGVIISALVCEAALHAKRLGKTLVDLLHDLYRRYGVHVEEIMSINFEESKAGKEQMKASMERLRRSLPKEVGGIPVVAVDDYLTSKKRDVATGKEEVLHLPKSDVLTFWLADQTKLIVRPSGTEPKVKLYCGVSAPLIQDGKVDLVEQQCHQKIASLLNEVKAKMTRVSNSD